MHEFDLKKIPEASEARRDAGRTLSVKGNRLLLSLGVLTLLPSVMLYILLESTIACVVSIGEPIATDHTAFLWGNGLYYLAALLLTLFFVMPLWMGLLALASKVEAGESAVLADVLDSFTSLRSYRRALRFSWGSLPRLLCICVVVVLTYQFAQNYAGASFLSALGMALLIALEVVLGFAFCAKDFFAAYLLYRTTLSPREARRQSRKLTRRSRGIAYRYAVDSLQGLLLSVITLGTVLVADTLPRMLVSYFTLCHNTNEMIIQSEENRL